MLGGVPINVIRPLSSEPNASGISNAEGGLLARLASRIATGMSRASAPTLFMKLDITATAGEQRHLLSGCIPASAQLSRQLVHEAGILQPSAYDQDACHRNHRRVAETAESVARRDDLDQCQRQQRKDRDHIVAQATREEQNQCEQQHAEDGRLVRGHIRGGSIPPTSGGTYHGFVPELPEVETIRRDLEDRIVGRRISAVRIPADTGKPVPVLKGIDEASFREGVVGARIEALERRGKYLAIRLDTEAFIVIHLRMTGALLHRAANAEPDRYLRAILILDDGTEVRFTDLRKFGGFWLVDDVSEAVATGLGPEPLGEDFTVEVVTEALRGRKTPVKSVLLDQSRVAGIGNIYADEACFAAGIDPRRLGASVRRPQAARLHKSIRDVLQFGVESRGASFRDYQDVKGESGSMQMNVKVFRRTGKPCYECGSTIQRVKLGGRSTHYCPKCQR